MKKMLFSLLIFILCKVEAQQNFSITPHIPVFSRTVIADALESESFSGDKKISNPQLAPLFEQKFLGVYGVGNLNSESLENLNAGGKISLFVKPYQGRHSDLTLYLSFNKNASNKDSLLASTLVFPEVGNNAFLGSVEYLFKKDVPIKTIGNGAVEFKSHSIGPFVEFSHKNIKVSSDSLKGSDDLYFSTLHYTGGLRYVFGFGRQYQRGSEEINDYGGLVLSLYISHFNIPDEDKENYKEILKRTFKSYTDEVKDWFWSGGLKVAFQLKEFQVFADFRHAVGSKEKLPIRELRGFNSNIGIVFNTQIFSL